MRCVAFSPDGRLVLTGSAKTVRVWEVASGRELIRLNGHQDSVHCVAFSPDGQLIVSGDEGGGVYCWEWRGSTPDRLSGLYLAAYEVKTIHWLTCQHLLVADAGKLRNKPNFYHLMLESI